MKIFLVLKKDEPEPFRPELFQPFSRAFHSKRIIYIYDSRSNINGIKHLMILAQQ